MTDYEFVREALIKILEEYEVTPTYLKSGGAIGFDQNAERFFKEAYNLHPDNDNAEVLLPQYRPNMAYWERLRAPLDRNGDIVKDTDVCIAFFYGTDRKKGGTMDAAKKAHKLGIPVIFYDILKKDVEYWDSQGFLFT